MTFTNVRNSLSACLPVHNRGTTIERALLSISQQSVFPDEIIICDFASDDEGDAIIKKWISRYQHVLNIHYFSYDFVPEYVEDWNITIEHASSNYIAVLEGDDAWPASYIEVAKQKINDDLPGMIFFPSENEKGKFFWPRSGTFSAARMLQYFSRMKCFAAPSQAVFIKSACDGQRFLYDDKNFNYAPEMDLYFRIAKKGYKTKILTTNFVYRGIGKRKQITKLYYQDHFKVLEKHVFGFHAFSTCVRLYLFYFLRITKRSFENDRLNKLSDLITLYKTFNGTIKNMITRKNTQFKKK